MSKNHGMRKDMWNLIKMSCTPGHICNLRFSNFFGYLFQQGSVSEYTEQELIDLSLRMSEHPTHPEPDLDTPIGFAFFGQFIDHDITLDVVTSLGEVAGDPSKLENLRTPKLDLDSIYGNGPEASPYLYSEDKLILGTDNNPLDVQRNRLGTAIIGDPRNDENLFISQMQSLFIRFHNWVVDQGKTFEEAREFVRWTYQKIVVEEFLPEIISENILNPYVAAFKNGQLPGPIPWSSNIVMPIEFSAAAFRFGHSHIRQDYQLNDTESGKLFDFSSFEAVPETNNIDWKYFFNIDGSSYLKCRPINTKLAFELFNLPFIRAGQANLAARNLIRGQLTFGLLSGERIAQDVFGVTPIPKHKAIKDLGLNSTPLWFYILAEGELNNGKLGLVGGSIVAGTLLQMLLSDNESYINQNPHFDPFLLLRRKESIMGSIASIVG